MGLGWIIGFRPGSVGTSTLFSPALRGGGDLHRVRITTAPPRHHHGPLWPWARAGRSSGWQRLPLLKSCNYHKNQWFTGTTWRRLDQGSFPV